jgi:hypothetical protein
VPTGKPLAKICGESLVVHTLRFAPALFCFVLRGACAPLQQWPEREKGEKIERRQREEREKSE